MAQTKLNFTISDYNPGDNTADVPSTGGDSEVVTSSASEEPVTEPKLTGSANTGFLTTESSSATTSSFSQEPIVFGTLIFLGIIFLLVFVVKLKKKKQLGFNKSMNQSRNTTAILGFLSLLMIFAGVGGAVSKYIGSSATTKELDDITTSVEVDAELIETGDNYNLYCATDLVTINATTVPYGYMVLMHTGEDNDTDGLLTSHTSSVQNIVSTGDWDNLAVGSWGYFVGNPESDSVYNPLPTNYSVVANEAEETRTTEIPVSFCAKLDQAIKNASFSATVNYKLLPREEGDIYPEIDFNSIDDDDFDGLLNREENRYGMNPMSSDTDMDSLSDYEELKTYSTNPLEEDTDEDGLSDYSEVALSSSYGTDPLNPHSCTSTSCDSAKLDGDQTYTYAEAGGDYSIPYTITGVGNIPLTYISVANPVDIDESLENLTGTAYTFQSAGDVIDAEITVPYHQVSAEDLGSAETTDGTEEELYGSVAITDDTVTDDNTFAIAMTFENEDEESETAQAVMNNTEKTINQENQTISIKVKDNQSILLVGNNNSYDEDLVGASLFSNKNNTWSVSSNFFQWKDTFLVKNNGGYYDGKNYYFNGGLCFGMSLLAELLYTQKINLNISHNTGIKSSIADGKNPDKELLFDGTFSLKGYSKGKILKLIGIKLAKSKIREDGKIIEKTIPYMTGAQGKAILALQRTLSGNTSLTDRIYPSYPDEKEAVTIPDYCNDYSNLSSRDRFQCDYIKKNAAEAAAEAAKHLGPEGFITTIKNKIDKNNKNKGGDDPIIIGVRDNEKDARHAANVYSLKQTAANSNTSNYTLGVYDNSFSIVPLTWKMECSKITCTITSSTTLKAPLEISYVFLKDPNYFMTH